MKYVLYHSNCYDGFGAAYAAWKKYGWEASYLKVSYGEPPPLMPKAEIIFILDFSYPKDVLIELSKRAKVIVIDHHKTAEEDLRNLDMYENLDVHFDMNRSGALMAWEYFHPCSPIPSKIKHISDRDLWKFELPYTKEFHAGLITYNMDFELWDSLPTHEVVETGFTCLRMQSQQVDNILKSSWIGNLDDHEVPMVNTTLHWSEVGEALQKKYPEAKFVATFTVFQDQIMWSLRCGDNFDVSEIAKKYGGGGHKKASGFKVPIDSVERFVGQGELI